ncbi:MAG: hypothetical protein LBB85_12930 [Dysgonamonadaceae bacterium]|jgi:hypothetical protein|nr:hypothetical protein [Dysgonamonadaceae bacterium]
MNKMFHLLLCSYPESVNFDLSQPAFSINLPKQTTDRICETDCHLITDTNTEQKLGYLKYYRHICKNISNMTTEILHGTEKRLYDLVAPLVLNPFVIQQNRGIAFKTTRKHVWIVSVTDNEKCTGFLPIQLKHNRGEINNYYIQDRDEELLLSLLTDALEFAKEQNLNMLDIITQIEDYETIQKKGFSVAKQFVKCSRFRIKV